ncbi:hypothetical protein Bca52824_093560 [Brassica carinata]|uniref:Uncharacterized protein n=1 Tax=Brassica carinata TaxID=52824 RepID=A0A8X7P5J2_BRACI|nr:hypothetical protein Bca52824_093560 [Brassica carinata]
MLLIMYTVAWNAYRARKLRVRGKVSEESSESHEVDNRPEVRMESFVEMKRFKERWKKAVNYDRCWVDPY